MRLEGSDRRGRPLGRWKDGAGEYMHERGSGRGGGFEQMEREYLDRERWWLFCHGHPLESSWRKQGIKLQRDGQNILTRMVVDLSSFCTMNVNTPGNVNIPCSLKYIANGKPKCLKIWTLIMGYKFINNLEHVDTENFLMRGTGWGRGHQRKLRIMRCRKGMNMASLIESLIVVSLHKKFIAEVCQVYCVNIIKIHVKFGC